MKKDYKEYFDKRTQELEFCIKNNLTFTLTHEDIVNEMLRLQGNKRLTFISKWSIIVSNEVTPIVTGGAGNSQLGGLVA